MLKVFYFLNLVNLRLISKTWHIWKTLSRHDWSILEGNRNWKGKLWSIGGRNSKFVAYIEPENWDVFRTLLWVTVFATKIRHRCLIGLQKRPHLRLKVRFSWLPTLLIFHTERDSSSYQEIERRSHDKYPNSLPVWFAHWLGFTQCYRKYSLVK